MFLKISFALLLASCLDISEISSSAIANSSTTLTSTSAPLTTRNTTTTTTIITTTAELFEGVNCTSSPCKNGATCTDVGNSFVCSCVCGYTGRLCEIVSKIDGCWSSPCRNGGTCYSTDDEVSYRCMCDERYFTGFNCEYGNSPCNSNPCRNGGACNANMTTFTYVCSCGCDYSGKYCETDLNPCGSKPCLNGGSCFRHGTTNYVCACPEGYAGLRCDFIGLLLKTNLALGRDVYQSTLPSSPYYSPKNIVDGTRDYNYTHNTCTQTKTETRPWIVVDFGNETDVKHVVVTGSTFGDNGNYEDCKITGPGLEYTGTMAKAVGNKPCMQWALMSNAQLPENYCRNPDSRSTGPWCYTALSTAYDETCSVPFCETNHLANFTIGLSKVYPPVYGQYSVCAQYSGVLPSPTVSVTCGPGTIPGRYLVLQLPITSTAIYVCEIEAYTNATLTK